MLMRRQKVRICERCDKTIVDAVDWVECGRSRKRPGMVACWCRRCESVGAIERYDNPTAGEIKRLLAASSEGSQP